MENWYKVTMPAEDWEPGKKGQRLINDFGQSLIAHGGPVDAAMFSQKSVDRAEVYFYFSPRAIAIAKPVIEVHSPVSCPAPARGTVFLAAGDVRAVEILLPKPNRND
jgi:hypothetical protein